MWICFNGYRTKYWNKRRFISTYPSQTKGYGRVVVNGWKKIPLCFTGQTRVNMAQLFEGWKILLVWSRSIDIFDKGSCRACRDTFELVTTLKSYKTLSTVQFRIPFISPLKVLLLVFTIPSAEVWHQTRHRAGEGTDIAEKYFKSQL